jgi:hypothetical protein
MSERLSKRLRKRWKWQHLPLKRGISAYVQPAVPIIDEFEMMHSPVLSFSSQRYFLK